MKINSNSFIGIILVVTHFWVPTQKIKKIKKKLSKNITVKKKDAKTLKKWSKIG
jgi:hypothetical protein